MTTNGGFEGSGQAGEENNALAMSRAAALPIETAGVVRLSVEPRRRHSRTKASQARASCSPVTRTG